MKKQFSLRGVVLLLLVAVLSTGLIVYKACESRFYSPDLQKYREALDIIDEHFVGEYSKDSLADAALAAMVDALDDRWSYYLTAAEYERYLQTSNNAYTGIGITIAKVEGTGGLLIESVYPDSPAERAGITAGEVIIAVEQSDITGIGLPEIKKRIIQYQQDGVLLTVLDSEGNARDITVKSEIIVVNPVTYEMLADNIGYIRLVNFEAGAADAFIAAAKDLRDQGAKGFVFDVRNDPGGRLNELTSILDFLLPEGTIFVSRDKAGNESKVSSDADCIPLPMTVLVNKNTYSAAEFFAAVLREFDQADVVGDKTTGKGRSQITLELDDKSAIHISSREYFTPGGVSLAQAGGLTPDYEVGLSAEDTLLFSGNRLDFSEDTQLQKAIEVLFP